MERILAYFIGLTLACSLAVIAVHEVDARTALITPKTPPDAAGPPVVTLVPGAGQAFVSGTADTVVAEQAQGEPINTPFTITSAGGSGRLTIENALVGGRRMTISWDGGTPLPVSGDGALDFGAAHIEIDGRGPVFSLDGAGRRLRPGSYTLGTAVAVGTGGLGTPREGVAFAADEQTTLNTRGDLAVRLGARPLALRGPGKLVMAGTFTVQVDKRRVNGATVKFGEGPFELTIEPGGAGGGGKSPAPGSRLSVSGILQGSVDVS